MSENKKTRKELQREYKERVKPSGVYQVKNLSNGKVLLGSSLNLEGLLNRNRFTLRNNSHTNKELQKDWNELGPDQFAFEVLDRFDAEDLRFRLSTVRELGPRLAALRRDSLECGIIWARDGYAAAYGFVRRGEAPIPEVGGGLELGANDVYVYDCFVSPSFRGRRLYPFLLRQLCAHARRRGAERAFIAVDAANVPSVRGIEAAGFRRDRAALYHRLGPLRSLRWEECRG